MHSYEMTDDAEEDIRKIATYSLKHYGATKMREYINGLEKCAEATSHGSSYYKELRIKNYTIRSGLHIR